ncbi:GSCFA domain-containing protein [Methylobacterium flocculans]|uniref:GSCFA domain-containing protein n=1 Tax=Methylobacterium flocculans TaxID=2984843 RepID=UPI0021F26A93|nr:GSCFA domain-containing protein [Methylobacterium sp. FF17]
MSANPYQGRPDYQFWKRGGGFDRAEDFDPVTGPSFAITPGDSVVTAGSCFAQHVSRHLMKAGFNVLVTEHAHPLIPDKYAAQFHYGLFAARYGNVYTARQLRQLLERAYGLFIPRESAWPLGADRWVDPFRPQIQPGGYVCVAELEEDRRIHLDAVRRAIDGMSVFVFTLGLTEAWVDRADGAVYPLAPGVAGGVYDPDRIAFQNFTAAQTREDLEWSLNFIRRRNPGVRVILTVSPVPLNATAVDRHVMVSTAYSKAALRVAAEEVSGSLRDVDYFPSFEIVTSPHAGSTYFADDRRSVTEAGVAHVMRTFLRHYGASQDAAAVIPSVSEEPDGVTVTAAPPAAVPQRDIDTARENVRREVAAMSTLVETLCDEEAIDNT